MKKYLESSYYIDYSDPDVFSLAKSLSDGFPSEEVIAKNCFEWVRDNIKHSSDFKLNPLTSRASDVLKFKTGYCFAKSHLLAALLRANKIPTGLCYQRLSIKGDGPPFSLHGLNAVFLKEYGWYRVDPRGNKTGINAKFTPPVENLAFSINLTGEADIPEIYSKPLPEVLSAFEKCNTYDEFYENLPDMEIR